MIDLKHINCLEFLKQCKENQFDLAIVDPPYRDEKDNNPVRGMRNKKDDGMDSFGDAPRQEYFDELLRVSKNQIIWGGNYFPELWNYKINKDNRGCKGFIFWFKNNPVPNFSDGELAWTSFNRVAKQHFFQYYGNLEGRTKASKKIHPTQKPVDLYKWLLMNYAKEGDSILDTHLGSGSIAIACHDLGFDLTGCEIDKQYLNAAQARLNKHKAKGTFL